MYLFMQSGDLYVVGIGASAGGQEALQKFFSSLAPDLPAAYVVVTHLLRNHESHLHKILARYTSMQVKRIQGMTVLERGVVYVMPEDVEAKFSREHLYLRPRGDGHLNKAIDTFLESLAISFQQRAVGIILSGMGSDGSEGAVKIFEQGGSVLVQAPDTTKFNSMPWAAIMKDHPDYVLPPDQLAVALYKLIRKKDVRVSGQLF
jgi:chemotaxis response regulator CheB